MTEVATQPGSSEHLDLSEALSPELFAKIKAIQIRTQRLVNAAFAGEYDISGHIGYQYAIGIPGGLGISHWRRSVAWRDDS